MRAERSMTVNTVIIANDTKAVRLHQADLHCMLPAAISLAGWSFKGQAYAANPFGVNSQ